MLTECCGDIVRKQRQGILVVIMKCYGRRTEWASANGGQGGHASRESPNCSHVLQVLEVCCQGRPEGGVDLVGHPKLLAGVQDQGCNGRIMGVADAREQVVYHLQVVRQTVKHSA